MLTRKQALQRFRADLQMQDLSTHTRQSYINHVKEFLEFCNRPIEKVDEMDIRQFLGTLIVEKKLSEKTVKAAYAAIRIFFTVTLKRPIKR